MSYVPADISENVMNLAITIHVGIAQCETITEIRPSILIYFKFQWVQFNFPKDVVVLQINI